MSSFEDYGALDTLQRLLTERRRADVDHFDNLAGAWDTAASVANAMVITAKNPNTPEGKMAHNWTDAIRRLAHAERDPDANVEELCVKKAAGARGRALALWRWNVSIVPETED